MSVFRALSSSLFLPSRFLFDNPPPPADRKNCRKKLELGLPLSALCKFLSFYEVRHLLAGEDESFLKFIDHKKPAARQRKDGSLHFTRNLWIAGYRGSNDLRIHTPTESMRCHVVNEHQIAQLVEFIRDFLSPTDIVCASLRPKPLTDTYLLALLSASPDSPQHGYLAEGVYAVEHNLPLDACIHLLTPFGLHLTYNVKSREVAFQDVIFHRKSESKKEIEFDPDDIARGYQLAAEANIMGGVRIERAPALACCPGTAVLLRGPHSGYQGQLEIDNLRRLGFLALHTGEVVEKAPAEGLYFNLADAQDRICFVQRVLAMRDELRHLKEMRANREQYHGKVYGGPGRYTPNLLTTTLRRRLRHLRGRVTPLNSVVGIDDTWVVPPPLIGPAPTEFTAADRDWVSYRAMRRRRVTMGEQLMHKVHRGWMRNRWLSEAEQVRLEFEQQWLEMERQRLALDQPEVQQQFNGLTLAGADEDRH